MISGFIVPENGPTADLETPWSAAIPTQDAEAALAFCRALAQLTHQSPVPSAASAVQASLNHPILSVVIPVYNEQDNLNELYTRLIAELIRAEPDFELVFVDDGSRDRSLEILMALAQKDTHVVVISLARNFGHQAAISAGLDQAHGNAVIVMDADLQDPPEVLAQFIAKWREGHDVVYAIREQRKEGWFKRALYAAFYRLLQRVANINIPLDAGDFCIMDRRVV